MWVVRVSKSVLVTVHSTRGWVVCHLPTLLFTDTHCPVLMSLLVSGTEEQPTQPHCREEHRQTGKC